MAQTKIGVGHPQARKLFSVALFGETQRLPSFRKNMIGRMPKQADAVQKYRGQSSPDYPFVEVNDLSKTAGDTVSVDLFNVITGKPIMGDRKLAGRMMGLTSSSLDISINQARGGVDPGGRMAQQRTLHGLREVSKGHLAGWQNRLEDQLCQVHVSGARGYQNDRDWVVPLESDNDFAAIMVNSVEPPTRNRLMFAGDATSVADLDEVDLLSLEDFDRIRATLDEMAFPIQPIRLEGDPQADEEPLYCVYVTSRQWHYIQSSTTDQNWRTFLSNAWQRAQGWKTHPLFLGSPGMWNGILIKKTRRAIRFPQGSIVKEVDADGVVQEVEAGTDVDRAVLMGAQALGIVHGKHQRSGYHYNWHEEETDHGNTIEFSVSTMGGKRKLRFKSSDGEVTDHGVMVIDSAAPPVNGVGG
jgi:N4-gp56 family major capsid protein